MEELEVGGVVSLAALCANITETSCTTGCETWERTAGWAKWPEVPWGT